MMLQEVKDLQKNAVNLLYARVQNQIETTFKAPTGSGKTYMMSDLMNRLVSLPDVVFVVSSLSKADLGRQNYEKFVQYKSSFPNLKPYLINSDYAPDEKIYIPDGYNVYVLPRDLYKEGSRIKESGAFLNLLLTLRYSGKNIYLIKDECHIATNNLDELNNLFYRIINFSATPKFNADVEITNDQAVEAKLIKHLAPESCDDSLFTVNPASSVEDAVNKYLRVKSEYSNKLKVNPCLIIQISNKNKAEEEWKRIKKIIDDPSKNLKWMYIVDDKNSKECDTNDSVKKLPVKRWKDFVKNNESLIDIVVFKMVITEGWDIPRACMLYQVRDSQSQQMDEQVLGRVRRNPILVNWENFDEEAHELALTSWVWGIVDEDIRKFKKVNIIDNLNFNVKTTKLCSLQKNNGFNLDEFLSSRRNGINTKSIFELRRQWMSVSEETSNLCWGAISDYQDWIDISNNISAIDAENNAFMEDYSKSMELDENACFSETSYFEMTNITVNIPNSVWKLNDINDNVFHFDSEAEKVFAKFLSKMKIKHWGKNYYPNSKIKFEYILRGKHSSYPDFILKDKRGEIHIFEVKSINNNANIKLDHDDYLEKIDALRRMYTFASLTTKQYFYIPIMKDDKWTIYRFHDGREDVITKDQLVDFLKTGV